MASKPKTAGEVVALLGRDYGNRFAREVQRRIEAVIEAARQDQRARAERAMFKRLGVPWGDDAAMWRLLANNQPEIRALAGKRRGRPRAKPLPHAIVEAIDGLRSKGLSERAACHYIAVGDNKAAATLRAKYRAEKKSQKDLSRESIKVSRAIAIRVAPKLGK